MVFCPLFQRSEPPAYTPRPATPPKSPIMDLSSLDGPPLVASRVLITPPDPFTPRIHEEPPTPQGAADTYHFVRSKPLPARPVSADPVPSQRQRTRPNPGYSSASTDALRNEIRLRRAPARRGRRSPSEDLLPHDTLARDERSQSPRSSPDPEAEPVHRRARSCSPLVWNEIEGMWLVEGPSPLEFDFSSSRSRNSRPPRHQMSLIVPEGEPTNVYHDGLGETPSPPSYDSHEFTASHVMRVRESMTSRWVSVARRMHNLSSG